MIKIEWAQFETFTTARGLDILMLEDDNYYYLTAAEFGFTVICNIDKNATDKTVLNHFESAHKSLCNINKPFQIAKTAICSPGWTLNCLTFNYETSNLSSKHCKLSDGITDNSAVTLKLFNAAGTEITTQEDADLYAVVTQIDFIPTYTYEIIEGFIYIIEPPTTPIYAYAIGAPDIPTQYGGSVDLCTGGFDVRFLKNGPYVMDGRAVKKLTYIDGIGANKIRFKTHHVAGIKCALQVRFGFYKA